MQTEAVVTYLKALCRHSSTGSDENQGQPQSGSLRPVRDSNRAPSEYKSKDLPLEQSVQLIFV
jgi:hypothetical protein